MSLFSKAEKENEMESEPIIPNSKAYRTVSINVTRYINDWIKNPGLYHGFLIDPMSKDDFRYRTTDRLNQIADFGVIEIASSEWYSWEGKIPGIR